MRRLPSLLLVVALGFTLASCGEEDAELLPGGTAREITANLETVQRLADEGDCLGAESAAQQVSEQVEAIEGVDERLKRALRDGAARLNEVVTRCEEEIEEVPEATEPEPEPAPDEDDEKEKEKEKQREKDEEKEDEEREEGGDGEEEEGDEVEESEPTLPPQAEGEGKGTGNGPGGDGGSPSGGVGPASPAGGGG